ncbi:MutS-related protein [Candidatus Cardinium hertigii]|uniref:MutS-related protein n=1 Tax=Candidatus Cardinium hertigii TaxID=247481 RepID=UPI003D7C5980
MRIISYLSFLFCLPTFAIAIEEAPSMATQLADHYLKSFSESVKPLPKANQVKEAKASNIDITQIHLSPRAERDVVFNEIFAKSSYYQKRYQQSLFNPYGWNDLHLFYGTTTAPDYHFLSRINKTLTVLGEGALASLIGAPIADLESLTKRQQLVALLCQDRPLYNDLKSALQHYQPSEKAMLSFWTETDPLYAKEYNKYLTRLFYTGSAASNKSATALQTKKIWLRDIWNIYSNYIWDPLIGLVSTEMLAWTSSSNSRSSLYKYYFPLYMPVYNLFHVETMINHMLSNTNAKGGISAPGSNTGPGDMKPSLYFWSTSITLHSFWQYYKGYRNYKEYAGVLHHLALRMADVQNFLITAKKIDTLVQQNPTFAAHYGLKLDPINRLLAHLNESSEVGNLLRYLEELPLRSWSYLRNHAGKLLASYKLFLAHKAIFHDAMYALGELDAFVSIATLIEETAALNGPHRYTFAKLLPPKAYTKPRLALVEMWNPMLTPTTAVGNDLTMDALNNTCNVIVTGPNAGGKSTFLTGVATAVVLSQTFGIAPAKSCELTPFSKINTYIEITDDIAAGKSLFMAEVDRFQSHLKLLKQLKKEEFSFTIFDEPFSGTNPIEGAAAEYSVLNYIAQYSNAFNIVATHYPVVMLLEQREPQKGFKNYKVFIKSIGKNGKIHYTYKVIPGASNQTIAIDILADQGYATEMLEQARDIINHPERYRKSFRE